MDQVLIAAQFTGFLVWAVGIVLIGIGFYGWCLWVHRRGIDRGWWR